ADRAAAKGREPGSPPILVGPEPTKQRAELRERITVELALGPRRARPGAPPLAAKHPKGIAAQGRVAAELGRRARVLEQRDVAAIGEARQQALRLEGGVGDELGAQVPVERGRGHAGRGQSTPRCTPPVVAGGASRKQAHSELLLTRGGLVPPRRAGGAGRARRCVEITPRGAATFSAGAIRKVLG